MSLHDNMPIKGGTGMKAYRWMSLHFLVFMTWGVFLPYWTGWMVHIKGVSVSEASFIMSLGLAARGISTLFFFPYLSGKFSSKALLNGARIGTLLALLCYIPADSFQSLLLVTLVLHVFYPALMPALDSACGVLVQHNELKAYGTSRQWGSAGFVSAGVILSVFTGIFGDQAILWALLLGTLIFACLSFMHAPAVLSKRPETDRARKEGMFALFRIKYFGLVLAIVILLQAAHASYYNYGYLFCRKSMRPHMPSESSSTSPLSRRLSSLQSLTDTFINLRQALCSPWRRLVLPYAGYSYLPFRMSSFSVLRRRCMPVHSRWDTMHL